MDISIRSDSRMRVLGMPVDVIDIEGAVSAAVRWARGSTARVVFVRDVASLMAAKREPRLLALHEHAAMVVPDGTPLVWIGRWRGYGRRIGRVAGADLVDAVCAASVSGGLTHYFYGGKPGVAAEMARRLSERHPGLLVAGVFSPPMREIGPDLCITDDMRAELDAIRRSGADFIWIGLSSPKQDYLAIQAAPLVGRGVFFAVGAAFDFHSGAVRRAPGWMRNNGLEWLHRLWSEPRRLWRRYLVLVPQFVWDLAVAGVVSGPRAAGHR